MTVVSSKGIGNLNCNLYQYQRTESFRQYALANAPLVAKLPPLIRIEENQEKGKVKTSHIIRGKYRTWSKTILTGLLPIIKPDVYSGDLFSKGKKSFLLIKVTPTREVLEVLFFDGFMPHNPTMRKQIAELYKSRFTI